MGLINNAAKIRHCHISVLTSYINSRIFMFQQVCTIEPLFFKMMTGIHCHPFEGRHLS